MAAFAITNACYVNVLTGVTLSRDEGMLKRFRGTPLPAWAYLFGRAASAALVALLSTAVVLLVGTAMYPVAFPWHELGALLVAVMAGIACFSTLGLVVSAFVPTAGAALPVAYGTLLPLAFVSDVFFPMDTSPNWLRTLASAFPLRPMARSLEAPFMPGRVGVQWAELGVVALWAAAAVALVASCFRWERSDRPCPCWWRSRRGGRRPEGRAADQHQATSRRVPGRSVNTGDCLPTTMIAS
jgi:ABC-2 type transport system permease protein